MKCTVRSRIHSGLRGIIREDQAPFNDLNVSFDFIEPQYLLESCGDPGPIFVPVTNEFQAEFVQSVRRNACMTPIIAIVNDVNGYQTYMAIKYGASCVFNIMVPAERQADSLRSVLSMTELPAPAGVPQPRVPQPRVSQSREGLSAEITMRDAPRAPRASLTELDRQERALLELLCGNDTMSVIAKGFYCSERSIYRRVRQLYDRFGVPGRTELRMVVAQAARPARVPA